MRFRTPTDRKKRPAWTLAAITAVASLSPVGAFMGTVSWVNGTTRSYIYDAVEVAPTRDVAIVPGIGARSRAPLPCLRERLEPALALYRAHKVRAILASGIAEPSSSPLPDEITTMVRWLTDRGVKPEHVLSDPAGYRTLDTMQRAFRVLGVASAIVVTQGIHLPRAVFLARAAGIDAVGFVAPTGIPTSGYLARNVAMKSCLAFADVYLLDRGPRFTDAHGARLAQSGPPPLAPQPAPAFSFFTSAISAGMAASQVATRP
ncbi:MAG: ElyC/SanA/YdcF family protein [Pseudomonadota bacterium]